MEIGLKTPTSHLHREYKGPQLFVCFTAVGRRRSSRVYALNCLFGEAMSEQAGRQASRQTGGQTDDNDLFLRGDLVSGQWGNTTDREPHVCTRNSAQLGTYSFPSPPSKLPLWLDSFTLLKVKTICVVAFKKFSFTHTQTVKFHPLSSTATRKVDRQ